MAASNAHDRITEEVKTWPGVTAEPHRFGGTEFKLSKRELGHIHGDHLVDMPFPMRVRDEIVAAGHAQPHHILPESGWISFYLRAPEDVERAIELLRRSYELAVEQQKRRESMNEKTS